MLFVLDMCVSGFVGEAKSDWSTGGHDPVPFGGDRVGAMQGIGPAGQHATVCANGVTYVCLGRALVVSAPVVNDSDILGMGVL